MVVAHLVRGGSVWQQCSFVCDKVLTPGCGTCGTNDDSSANDDSSTSDGGRHVRAGCVDFLPSAGLQQTAGDFFQLVLLFAVACGMLPVSVTRHVFCNCCRSLQLVWRVFFRGEIWDCLSTLWPSGEVGVACELRRALVVGTADAAVCAAVRWAASQAAAGRPSGTQKLYVRRARGAGVGSSLLGAGCVRGAWEEWIRAWVSPWLGDSRRETALDCLFRETALDRGVVRYGTP